MNELLFDNAVLPPGYRSGFVAVVGRPNVGKSTLMNSYLGQKIAIVSPKAQTTRNQLLGILTLETAQVIFVDTPGIHEPHHKFGQYLVDVAVQAIPNADLVLILVDASSSPTAADRLVFDAIQQLEEKPPLILAMNKIDLLDPQDVDARLGEFLEQFQPDFAIAISAKGGQNQAKLLKLLTEQLPLGPRLYPEDQVTEQHMRFIAAELVREAALKVLRQEIPHALAVVVNEFKERANGITYIDARIFVERDSQKGIVIGQGGKTLKKIGSLARPQIEDMLEGKVFLELHVKVRPKWRKDKEALKRLGYSVGD